MCVSAGRAARIARRVGGFRTISPRPSGGVCGWNDYAGFTVLDYVLVNVGMFYILAIVDPSFTAHARWCNLSSPVGSGTQ